MDRSQNRRTDVSELEQLLEALSMRQYLSPHEAVSVAMSRIVDDQGVCPDAIQNAIAWLHVDPAAPIGRLRRTELMQLARSIHRFWRRRQIAASETL